MADDTSFVENTTGEWQWGNGERGNGSENFSALLSTFLTISNKKSYSKTSEISENLSEVFGPLPLSPLPFYLSTKPEGFLKSKP